MKLVEYDFYNVKVKLNSKTQTSSRGLTKNISLDDIQFFRYTFINYVPLQVVIALPQGMDLILHGSSQVWQGMGAHRVGHGSGCDHSSLYNALVSSHA
jgi:hypothetical protein